MRLFTIVLAVAGLVVAAEKSVESVKSAEKSWNWHWHLYSLVKQSASIELHPQFSADGAITGFSILKGSKRIEVAGCTEEDLKEGLINSIDM